MEDPDNYILIPGTTDQLRRARANNFENLKFFSTETSYARKIEYLGMGKIKGMDVEKVKVIYGPVHFIRHFNPQTGELVFTEIENGEGIEEGGEVTIDGIRFPQSVTNYKDGKLSSRVDFDSIEVNPKLDRSLFTQPALPGLKKK